MITRPSSIGVRLTRLVSSLVGTGILLFASPAVAEQSGSRLLSDKVDLESRINRVERGLLLPVQIESVPDPAMELAERMQHYQVPGVSVAVINNGAVEWARGYGVRELGSQKPVTPKTLFQAGSLSKPVAAMAALVLVRQGELELDENINDRLVSWKVPEGEFTREQKVSLRGLLSHTAGMTIHGFPGYGARDEIPSLLQVLDGIKPANTEPVRVDMTPNRQWRYSGGGYTVMQQLLIDVAGEPFPDLLEDAVLEPVGMRRSTYRQTLSDEFAMSAAAAHRYGRKLKGKWHRYPEMAAAGLWSTPSDLALLALELQNAISGKSEKVLPASMANLMVTPVMQNHGLGWEISGENQSSRFVHSGINEGFEALLVAYAHTGQGAVVMTNGVGGIHLAHEIVRGIAREYAWTDFLGNKKLMAHVNPELFEAYAGHYELAPNIVLTISRLGDRLFLQAASQRQFRLFPESSATFFTREFDAQITFVTGESGRVNHLVIDQQEELRARKIK